MLPSKEINDAGLYTNFAGYDVINGRIRVKLKQEISDSVMAININTKGQVTTKIKSLDSAVALMKITHIERTFPDAGKYEERTRREGLHLWYDIWFSEKLASTRVAENIGLIDAIQVAVPILKTVPTTISDQIEFDFHTHIASTNAPFLFNDEYLNKQWSYNNLGGKTWQVANADIRLFDIWQEYNGHPDIIISVVDGGIATDHPDLKDNIWINPREIADNGVDDDNNGYIDDIHGYNFVSNTSLITSHRHGTHVAGIIAAINNNVIGVSGIAGGNGKHNSGVKLMNSQIFEHPNGNYLRDVISDNIGAAIKYGADNGAIISQNSWGYAVNENTRSYTGVTQKSYIDPAHKAAIDYFIKYAGCDNEGNQLPNSPMKGGMVLFAVGNNGSYNPRVAAPADYEKVIAVTAIGSDYKKPIYANYGEYVDICAPGGTSNSEEGIFSTTIPECGNYEFRYGTSMACPHVAAVAALVIQKHGIGKLGFTPKMLEEILLTTAYDVGGYNPNYIGQLGYGCIDATAALQFVPSGLKPLQLIKNPIKDGILEIRVNNVNLTGDALLSIISSTGKLVMRDRIKARRFIVISINISKLSIGYYTFKYECKGQIEMGNFLKN